MSRNVTVNEVIVEFCLRLYNNTHIPRSTVQKFIDIISSFISDIFIILLNETIVNELVEPSNQIIVEKVIAIICRFKDSFHNFSTQSKGSKCLRNTVI